MEVDSAVLYVLVLTFSFLCPCVRGNRFEEVESCPENEQEWNERARKKKCTQALPDFMCAAIENKPGRFGEICSIVGLSAKGYCAVLDEDTYNLNYIKCLAASGCPETVYRSSEVYKYKACYSSEPSTTPMLTANKHYPTISHSAEKIGSTNAVTLSTFVLYTFICILVLLVISIYWLKRKREYLQGKRISLLGNYMKSRSVAMCNTDVEDLRYKMFTHSKSLKHIFKDTFNEKMISTIDDLRKFDLDVVYILLTNFCGIPCPDQGWGIKPRDEDISLGADIERIRILVSKYLDDGTVCMEEYDQILERLKTGYGEIDPIDDIMFCPERKINYVKVMPNNVVEKEVVVTQGIADILEKMESKKVVICHGAIGCGKSTALDYVTKKYKDNGWIIEWMEECFDESCTERLLQRDIEKTVICIDNLFGSFGFQVLFNETFNKFKNFMRKVVIWEKKPIVLLGIHQNVYDEIPPQLDLFPTDKSLFVDLNVISDSEALQIYKLQQPKNKNTQGEISIGDFLYMIEHRSNEVGTPFQTLMISAAPGIFGNKRFCQQPFQRLTEYFDYLYINEKDVFCSLLYITCVIFFDPSEDKLDLDVAKAISDSLNTKTITLNLSRLTPYTHDDGNAIEIKHDLIAMALFHALMRKSDNLSTVLKVYDIRRILELVRPGGQYSRLHQFAVPVEADVISFLKKKSVGIDIGSDM